MTTNYSESETREDKVEGLELPPDLTTTPLVEKIDVIGDLLALATTQLADAKRLIGNYEQHQFHGMQEQIALLTRIVTSYQYQLDTLSHVVEAVDVWNGLTEDQKQEQIALMTALQKDYQQLKSWYGTYQHIKQTLGVESIGDAQAKQLHTAYVAFFAGLKDIKHPSVGASFWSYGGLEFLKPQWDAKQFDELTNLVKIEIPQPAE